MEIRQIVLLVTLGMVTLQDIVSKKISILPLAIAGIGGVILEVYDRAIEPWQFVLGALLGLALIMFGILSGGALGTGDGLVIVLTGIYTGFEENLVILWIASVIAGLAGVISIALMRKSRKSRMAFVPSIMVSYCLVELMAMAG